MDNEKKDKQEKAYEEALYVIKHGSVYYATKIQETKKEIRELGMRNSEAARGLSAKQIEDKKEYLQGQVAYLQRKNGKFVEKQQAIEASYLIYQKSVEKRGANYFGDNNVISNLALARGIEEQDRVKDKISATFKKEYRKIEKAVNESFEEFDKKLTKNATYIINNEGRQVFNIRDFSVATFKTMLVNKNNEIERNYPQKQSLQELEQQKNEILGSIDGYNQIQEVLKPENEFNISVSMEKDLDKCSHLYADVAKHKLIVAKIEEVLNRFEVDDKDKSHVDENKNDRSKEYAKLCKALHKLKQKEEKSIKKLENKVRKPMEKNNVEKLCGLVEERKAVEVNKNRIGDLEMQISAKESELAVLSSVGNEIGQDKSNLEKLTESKNIQEKINKLEKEIQEVKAKLQESKAKLEQSQAKKTKHTDELRQYTTKSVSSRDDSDDSYVPKDFYSELQKQTISDKEYMATNKELEERDVQKTKQEQSRSI